MNYVGKYLADADIQSNNTHAVDNYGEQDFQIAKCVTLSTVHKAKGNEAFMVYILGVDALFEPATVKSRNMLFTAMTRAKGWIRLLGIGTQNSNWYTEILTAFYNVPKLEFVYPGSEELRVIHRELKQSAIEKTKAEKALDDAVSKALGEMTTTEIEEYIRSRTHADEKKSKFLTNNFED